MVRPLRYSINVTLAVVFVTTAACAMRPLTGTVVGSNGELLSACAVTLEVGTNGGLRQARTTNDAGNFSFGNVSTLGGCAIRFEKSGYETQNVECPSDGKPLRVVLRRTGNSADSTK